MGADIGPLAPVNFFFGSNGSGKTTISRALADSARFRGTTSEWDPPTGELGVKVYNRDYVEATFAPAAHLPGVFLLGEESAESQAEIESLTGANGSIAAAKGGLASLQSSLTAKRREIGAVRGALQEAAWTKRNAVPPELREMFAGYNSNKDKFLKRLLDVATANTSATGDFATLALEAGAVLADDAQILPELPIGPEIGIEGVSGYALLGLAVVGSAHVSLAPLIRQLGNADWIRQGRVHLDHANGVCPFCQQAAPPELGEQLEAYFDQAYVQQVEQLTALNQHFESWTLRLATYLDDLPAKPGAAQHLDTERLANARVILEKVIADVRTQFGVKLVAPSRMLSAPDLSEPINSLNDVVRDANSAIRRFNLLLKNRVAARKRLLDHCWVVFARVTLLAELNRYEGAMPGIRAGEFGLAGRIQTAETDIRTKELRLRELQGRVTSSKPIIDRINGLLYSVGFHSFSLQESIELQDGYTLLRPNGENATETLSEGERTFITFLYFAQSLRGAPQDATEPNDVLAVIDDPISSLDSDVLYAVSALVRRIVDEVETGEGRVRQLLLMTHNAYFHKEVTYQTNRGPKLGPRKFGIVRKRGGQRSEVEIVDHNPVRTAYVALWDEVKSAQQNLVNAVGLQNTLRRILETYFKVLGGVDTPAVVGRFKGDEQIICRSLFSWVNAGSHSIFDDLDYSPTPATVESNLQVFRRIFEEHGQIGHYNMMMGNTVDGVSMEEGLAGPHS